MLFKIRGRIDAVSQSEFNSDATRYSVVDFIDENGRRLKVRNVVLAPVGSSCMYIGATGDFFFDKLSLFRKKHLYAAHLSTGEYFFDNQNARLKLGLFYTFAGLLGSLLLVGIPFLVGGVLIAIGSIPVQIQKRVTFYGNGDRRAAAHRQPVLEM